MPTDPAQSFQTRDVDGVTVITLTAPDIIREAFPTLYGLAAEVAKGPEPRRAVLNLGQLHAFRSELIAVLINVQKTIRDAGGALKVSDVQPEVRRLLELTRVTDLLDIVKTEDEAVRAFKGGSWFSKLFGGK